MKNSSRIILIVRHGSHAYGTNIKGSDEDYKGICISSRDVVVPDLVIYGIRKFFRLAEDCNPNALEMLWSDPSDLIVVNSAGKLLLESRELFISKKARSISNYAAAYLRRARFLHKRKQEYGKHASNVIRLMRMCKEILETGKVIVKRPDREELLGIRLNHTLRFNELEKLYKEANIELDNIVRTSTLCENPDRKALNKLYTSIIEDR